MHFAIDIEGEFAVAIDVIVLIVQPRCGRDFCAVLRLTKALRPGVLPVQLAEFSVALPRIEIDLLASDNNDGQLIVELVRIKIQRLKNILITIHHRHGIRFQPGCANHGNEEQIDILR